MKRKSTVSVGPRRKRKANDAPRGATAPCGTKDERTIDPTFKRDVQESEIPQDVMAELLKDHATNQNVLWLTDDYKELEAEFGRPMGMKDPILAEVIARKDRKVIRPRVDKSREQQRARAAKKAEVFTPSWICNEMNNLIDAAWFGLKESPFTKEKFKAWEAKKEPIRFPGARGETWEEFVKECRLEITCGEAPFLASRYDATTGEMIPVPERMGILDRKLRVVTEQVGTTRTRTWLKWAKEAVKASWGYEWQGDNIVLARENILMTVLETYKYHCHALATHKDLLELAEIISWNIWQMDGLKCVVPLSCHDEPVERKQCEVQMELFASDNEEPTQKELPLTRPCPGCAAKKPLENLCNHNGIPCMVMNWETKESYPFTEYFRNKSKT